MALGVAVLHQLLQFSAQLPGLARDIGTDHIPGLLTSLLGLKAEVRGDPWRRGGAEQGCMGAQRPLAARRGRAGMCGGTATRVGGGYRAVVITTRTRVLISMLIGFLIVWLSARCPRWRASNPA